MPNLRLGTGLQPHPRSTLGGTPVLFQAPLDGISIVEDIHAYSTRLLRTDYFGDLIQVRRTADNEVRNFTYNSFSKKLESSDLYDWWDEVGREGRLRITEMFDQYTPGTITRHVSQSNQTKQPFLDDGLGNILVTANGFVCWETGDNRDFLGTDIMNPKSGDSFCATYADIATNSGPMGRQNPGGWALEAKGDGGGQYRFRWKFNGAEAFETPSRVTMIDGTFDAVAGGSEENVDAAVYVNGTKHAGTPGGSNVGISKFQMGNGGGGGRFEGRYVEAFFSSEIDHKVIGDDTFWTDYQNEQIATLGAT